MMNDRGKRLWLRSFIKDEGTKITMNTWLAAKVLACYGCQGGRGGWVGRVPRMEV